MTGSAVVVVAVVVAVVVVGHDGNVVVVVVVVEVVVAPGIVVVVVVVVGGAHPMVATLVGGRVLVLVVVLVVVVGTDVVVVLDVVVGTDVVVVVVDVVVLGSVVGVELGSVGVELAATRATPTVTVSVHTSDMAAARGIRPSRFMIGGCHRLSRHAIPAASGVAATLVALLCQVACSAHVSLDRSSTRCHPCGRYQRCRVSGRVDDGPR